MATPAEKVTDIENQREKGSFWSNELAAARKTLQDFHKRGIKVIDRYLDERGTAEDSFRLNLFHQNVQTMQDMMYDNLPKIETSRRNADSGDDVARVSAEMMERLLNLDLSSHGQKYDSVLRSVLQDRLLPGLGVARVRYEFKTEQVEVPSADVDSMGNPLSPPTFEDRVVWEDAPVDYYHWQDVLWGWGRNFAELPWIAFRSYLSKDEVKERFGKLEGVEFKNQKAADVGDGESDEKSPRQKAEIWEIWDKETRRVRWLNNSRILDRQDDPLKLKNFFPCPAFLIANASTTLYRPVPDYYLSQDLYNEVDVLQTRIATITEAVKVVGVYDSRDEGIKRMMSEAVENDLVPVENWSDFSERGGLKGVVDWFPIETVVSTLDKLRQLRDDTIQLLQQTSGMADVQQGQLRNQYEGVGQTQIKAQYGSIRVQSLQNQFACFVSDLMQLKAEVICKHFEPETIIQRSNAQFLFDQNIIMPAVQLLKQPDMAYVRIVIRPETMAMIDYAQLKSDRTEFLTAMATFMQSAAPLLQTQPNAMPYLLKMLQWSMAGFKGSQEIEGVLDQAVAGAIKEAENPQQKPDPAKEASQAKLVEIQAKAQADLQTRQADAQADVQTIMAQHQAKMEEIQATHEARMREITTKGQLDVQAEEVEMAANIQQAQAAADTEMEKDQATTIFDVRAKKAEHNMEPEEEEDSES